MAYVKDSYSAGGTDAVTVAYTAQEDDFLFLVSSRYLGSDPSTPSGWTALSYTAVEESGSHNIIWYRRATSSEPTSVTVTASLGGTGKHSCQLVVCRGVDTTTAFDVTLTERSSSSAASADSAAITPTTANTLILYLVIPNNKTIAPTPGLIKVARTGTSIEHGSIYSYYTYGKGASVAVTSHKFHSENDANINPTILSIALRDDGNNNRKGFVDKDTPPADLLHFLGLNGNSGDLTGTAEVNVSATVTTLQGTSTTNNTNPQGSQQLSFEDGFTCAGYSTTFTKVNCPVIGTSLAASVDIEADLISFTSAGDAAFYQSFDDLSKHFGVGDGTNFRMFKVDAVDTVPSGKDTPIVSILEVDGGFESVDFGTVSSTVLQNIDHFVMAGPGNSTYDVNGFGFVYRLNTMIIMGGSTNFPASMSTAVECSRTGSLRTINNQSQQSDTQFYCAHAIQVGDGTTATVWNSQNHSIAFPPASDTTERKVQVQASSGNFGIIWDASASCNFDMRGTFDGGNFAPWGLASGTSTSATYNESGAKVIGHAPVLRDIGREWTGVSFTLCSRIAMNGADISGGGCIIDGSTDSTSSITPLAAATEGALQLLLNDIASTTFKNCPVAIRIEYTGAGAPNVNFDAITVSGNTVDLHFNATNAVQLTANMQNGSNITTTAISGSATGVTISNDVTVTITVNVTGAEITFLNRGTQTEVYHVETGSTTQGYTYTYSSDVNLDIQVYKPGYIAYWNDQEALLSTDQTINVVLESEPASQI